MGEFGIGQGVPRFEDPRLVRGGGHYIDDVVYPGMAYGVVLRSPHAHAKIVSIDTTEAKASPGVLCVITAADWKASGFGDLPSNPGLKRRGGAPMALPRYPVLAVDRVRWVGDCVVHRGGNRRAGDGRLRKSRRRLRGTAGGDLGRGGREARRGTRA